MRSIPAQFLYLGVIALLGGPAVGAPRTVGDILSDYVAARGRVTHIKTLRVRSQLFVGSRRIGGVTTAWRLPGACIREIPSDAGAWIETYGKDGAFISRGAYARYRPDQTTTRGLYYLFRILARPFPLEPYVRNNAARAGLKVGHTVLKGRRHDALYSKTDAAGVRAVYIFDPDTHLLVNTRYVLGKSLDLANVTYSDHRRVDGVMLPHAMFTLARRWAESDEKGRLLPSAPAQRDERRDRWEINPNLKGVVMGPRGLGRGGGKGFSNETFSSGVSPHEVAVGDLDGDGKQDIAVACFGGIAVHFGGAFDRPEWLPLGKGHHRGLVCADVDCDGRLDLVTSSNVDPSRTYFIVSFDEKRKPTGRTQYGAPLFVRSLAGHDFDRDGVIDFAAAGWARKEIRIRFGNGALGARIVGTGWPLDPERKKRRGYCVDVGNVNGDEHDDLAVCDGQRLLLFEGDANLSFHPRMKPLDLKQPADVELVDLDGDGRDDALVASMATRRDIPRELAVIRNTGGSLKVEKNLEVGASVRDVESGDLNGDGKMDAVATSYLTGEVVVLYGDGDCGFARPVRFRCGRGAERIAIADVNGDGRDDIVVGNNLGDSITVLINQGEFAPVPRSRLQPTATAIPVSSKVEFKLEGLSDTFEFAGEFLIPSKIPDPSGLAVIGGDPVHTQIVFVSDKRSAIFRAIVEKRGERLLVGPEVPLLGYEGKKLDLEGVAYFNENLFLACEADSHVLRATIFGRVLGRADTGVESTGNDGLEAIALRVRKDGTPVLYAFKERFGKTGRPNPGVRAFGIQDDPFALLPRGERRAIPTVVLDQTGATYFWDRLFVVSRLFRGIAEIEFDDDAFKKNPKITNFRELTDTKLGLLHPPNPLYGLVEGIAFDPDGDLYLLVDHNGDVIGKEGFNRGRNGRLLWFKNVSEIKSRPRVTQVEIKQILVPVAGAGAPGVELKPEEAATIARKVLARAKAGEDFDALAAEAAYRRDKLPVKMAVVRDGKAPAGAFPAGRLPLSLRRLAFRLEVGEIGLCEHHAAEAPAGYRVVVRVK